MQKDNEYINHQEKIRLINTWFKIAIVSAITAVILYRVIIGTFDFSSFDFSDLLSLILAIFSIWLSIMFYLKAEETSNTFYDNTYKFTQDVSVILGRIEAGFDERLKHIAESYGRIENYYLNDKTNDRDLSLEKHEEEVKEVEEEKQEIEDLINQSKLAQREKQEILEKLKNTQNRLSEALAELENYRKMQPVLRSRNIESSAIEYFIRYVVPNSDLIHIPRSEFAKEFQRIAKSEPSSWIRDLKNLGLIDDDLKPTNKGLFHFLRAIRENF